jgi:hypothetical protein
VKEPEVLAAEARVRYRNGSRMFWSVVWLIEVGGLVIMANDNIANWPPVGYAAAIAVCAPMCLGWHWFNVNVRDQVSDTKAEALRSRLLGREASGAR